jgi:hypothetical protein
VTKFSWQRWRSSDCAASIQFNVPSVVNYGNILVVFRKENKLIFVQYAEVVVNAEHTSQLSMLRMRGKAVLAGSPVFWQEFERLERQLVFPSNYEASRWQNLSPFVDIASQ